MAEIEVNPPRGIIGYISQFLTFLYILYLGLCWIIYECVIFAGGVLGTLLAPVFWLGHLPWRAVTAVYQIVEVKRSYPPPISVKGSDPLPCSR